MQELSLWHLPEMMQMNTFQCPQESWLMAAATGQRACAESGVGPDAAASLRMLRPSKVRAGGEAGPTLGPAPSLSPPPPPAEVPPRPPRASRRAVLAPRPRPRPGPRPQPRPGPAPPRPRRASAESRLALAPSTLPGPAPRPRPRPRPAPALRLSPGLPVLPRRCVVLRSEFLAVGGLGSAVLEKMDETCEMKYRVMDSPLGKLEISGCEQGLHGIKLHGGKTPDTRPAEATAPAEQLGGPGAVQPLLQCAAWLDAYFREPAVLEGLPVPALHHPIFQKESFTRQVLWKLLKLVKFGETVSYQQLAALAGNPRAARAVGGAMRSNPIPILIPCHRVVCSSGAMGNYSGGVGVKEWLLVHEGHPARKAAHGGGSCATSSWRGALGNTTSSQPSGRD
ncbi:hypothetical protein R6Z07F_018035 [Ovis aries]